jgi:enoyl-CoA hydratase
MTSAPLIETVRDDHVLIITMQREAKRNAVDRAMADQLDAALNLLEDDSSLWVGVLAASGPFFSAGSDLTSGGHYNTDRGGQYGIIRRARTKPLIAAVDGPALGGGLEIVLACDLVVASSAARFGLPEVKRGLVPTCAGLFRGPRALPLNLARQLALTGESIGSDRAHAVGFVNILTAPGRARPEALAYAHRISQNAPTAVRACLAAINGMEADSDDRGWDATDLAISFIRDSYNRKEGISAFLEKRPPEWSDE